jgi:hypothetical protein
MMFIRIRSGRNSYFKQVSNGIQQKLPFIQRKINLFNKNSIYSTILRKNSTKVHFLPSTVRFINKKDHRIEKATVGNLILIISLLEKLADAKPFKSALVACPYFITLPRWHATRNKDSLHGS